MENTKHHSRQQSRMNQKLLNSKDLNFPKLPPQATEIEEALLGACMNWENLRDEVAHLKPEHFYKEANSLIWKAITEVEKPELLGIMNYLKAHKILDEVGGAYYLTSLSSRACNPTQADYYSRIIQQQWIKRELIRISGTTIQKAYDDSEDPIQLFDEYSKEIESIETLFSPELSHNNIISGKENEAEVMDSARKGELKMGLTTGFTRLDEYFRFKPESFVIANGHDNVGKTAMLVYLAVVSNKLHGWRWIFACMENQEGIIRQETMQFVSGKHISKMTETEYQTWYNWSLDNFTILKIGAQITAERLMRIAAKINSKNPHQGFFIDPYNALDIDIENSKLSSHEFHYRVTGLMRNFIKKHKCSIWLNTHAVTEALRRIHKDGDYTGYPMPPEKADVEGGGKFANRADDFLTIHRYGQHPQEFNVTQIHVRKIKVTQTGGRQTPKDEPVKLKMMPHYFGFFDEGGESPLVDTKLPPLPTQSTFIQQNPIHNNHDDQPF